MSTQTMMRVPGRILGPLRPLLGFVPSLSIVALAVTFLRTVTLRRAGLPPNVLASEVLQLGAFILAYAVVLPWLVHRFGSGSRIRALTIAGISGGLITIVLGTALVLVGPSLPISPEDEPTATVPLGEDVATFVFVVVVASLFGIVSSPFWHFGFRLGETKSQTRTAGEENT